jgi:hypothetical protein
MCKLRYKKVRLPALAGILALIGLSMFIVPMKSVAQNCVNVMSATPVVAFPPGNAGIARIGDIIPLDGVLFGNVASVTPPNCDERNIDVYMVLPDGSPQILVSTNATILSGQPSLFCTGTAGANDGSCQAFTTTYQIKATDVNKLLTIHLPRHNIDVHNTPTPRQVQFFGGVEADGFLPGTTTRSGQADGSASGVLNIITPCITITKVCDYPAGANCFPYGSAIKFTGTVCNTGNNNQPDPSGNHDLINIAVIDTPPAGSTAGPITFDATTSLGNAFDIVTNNKLIPGDCIGYHGSYTPPGTGVALCGPFTNTIAATAVDVTGRCCFGFDA